MGAELVDQSELAAGVAKRQQPLGQQLHPYRRTVVLGEFFGQQRGQPIAAEQLAARRSGAGLGQKIILLFSQHGAPPRSWVMGAETPDQRRVSRLRPGLRTDLMATFAAHATLTC